jgi:hypothetical protein
MKQQRHQQMARRFQDDSGTKEAADENHAKTKFLGIH